ncbi:60S ribosomal protein L6, putative [Trichomonas vaginalis G3]|uniref:60S ribosomal protein L6, putative n=1 Tax=Trichomonas vaginalis (strain ATCC PRA-98 / G3) TaxID=412133 RepID=A2FXW1_TRIV3|nr:ribosomal large subunit assembly [Trichomonas vaginalis G3]EAX90265.1 60S ribosomal protein L6, putative [Trichomonas vaginalis G3]KAI5499867.1 ribosomal large subunit assembly [Trichomonas vaginalis G3]5XY3_E Chain E, 60S ribosomal protein L6, putative [Trichomonas vaginalis]|eukprot:XP_001303195.1 60S ribosomal protein L6 [Trichomonas vaginalis G3]
MAELLFISPIAKKDIKRPSWRGIPRISFTRPAVAAEVDPIAKPACNAKAVETRANLKVGTVVIIVGGEHQGKRAVVVADQGAGIVKVAGPVVPVNEISQDYLIATSTSIDVAANATEAQVEAAAAKVPEMVDYLKAPFTIKKGNRIHLMKF